MKTKTLISTLSNGEAYDVIVFSAHPDDAEMLMGGTILKLANSGYRVLQICLTRGEMGTYGTPEGRTDELVKASQILGCDLIQCDLPDLEIENDVATRREIARLIRQYRPRLVFSPYHTNPIGELGGIANVDHYNAGALVRDAAKFARLKKAAPDFPPHTVQKLYFYMLPKQVEPTLFVDVTPEHERVVQAIRQFASQLNIQLFGLDILQRCSTYRATLGLALGVPFAEAFVTEMPIQMTPGRFFEL